jgi:hypothetical protein
VPRRSVDRRAPIALAAALVIALTIAPVRAEAQATQTPYREVSGARVTVNGTYTPLVGTFVGADAIEDILWYAPGSGAESLWRATGSPEAPFTKVPVPAVNGTYVPIVGDFSGDGNDDVLWYGPGTAPDTLWNFTPSGLTTRRVSVNGTFTPIVLPNATQPDSIFWYAPGTATDWLWVFALGGGSQTSAAYAVNSRFTPIAGDFGDDSLGDLLWYSPGSGADVLWTRTSTSAANSFTASAQRIDGTYTPVVGDFGASSPAYVDASSDIVWLTDAGSDQLWDRTHSTWQKTSVSIAGPKAARIGRPGTDTIISWGGGGSDTVWRATEAAGFTTRSTGLPKLASDARPIVGRFGATADEAVLWYRPGAGTERYWVPQQA